MMTCINCGGLLRTVPAPDSMTPPHHCPACSRLWWDVELTDQARSMWSPHRQDFGFSEAGQMIRLQSQVARDMARAKRGLPTSPVPPSAPPSVG